MDAEFDIYIARYIYLEQDIFVALIKQIYY